MLDLMKIFYRILCLCPLALIFFVACSKDPLSAVEATAHTLQRCLVDQVIPGECDTQELSHEQAKLRATAGALSQDQISAATELGKTHVAKRAADSPYARVKSSFARLPIEVEPVEKNFLPYKTACPNFIYDIKNTDPENAMKLLQWAARERTRYFIAAYWVKGPKMTVLAMPVAVPCRPRKSTDINDSFPIVLPEQLEQIQTARRIKTADSSTKSVLEVSVEILENFDAIEKRYQQLTQ